MKPNQDISFLYPPFAKIIRAQEDDWNHQHPKQAMWLYEGYRSFERQAELYAVGRTVDGVSCSHPAPCPLHPRGLRVTNAPPGFSWHNYGLGADKLFDADPVKPGLQATWDGKLPWPQFAQHAVQFGLESAAFWKSFPEFPHVQLTYGLQLHEAYELHQRAGLDAVWKAIDLTRQVAMSRLHVPS